MISIIKQHIVQHFPQLQQSKLLLAVSGGVDSVVMTHVLKQLGFDIGIAHVNFQLRADESRADEDFVKELGLKWNIPVFIKKAETEKYAKENGLSIQMAAREIRYQWFETLQKEKDFDFVLTAHHLDDDIETFFINLNRKSGLEGLTGIPAQNGTIIRPFLTVSREEIEQYALENKLTWREDKSNATLKYERNQIRHLLMPVLHQINPDFKLAFKSSQQFLKQSKVLIQDYIELVKPNFWKENTSEIQIDLLALKKLPNFHFVLYEVLKNYNFTDWDSIYELVEAQTGKKILSETHQLLKNRNFLILTENSPNPNTMNSEKPEDTTENTPKFYDAVFKPQENHSAKKVKSIIKKKVVAPKYEVKDLIEVGDEKFKVEQLLNDNSINFRKRGIEYFDVETLVFPLYIRQWQAGDYFFPLGMNGKKKLSDYFVDIKLSVLEKEKIWLLTDANDQILWVIGYRIDNRFKVTNSTKKILKISSS